MKRSTIRKRKWLGGILLLGLMAAPLLAQRAGYSKDEFVRRRQALRERVKDGIVVFFGEDSAPAGAPSRQDNDFFYLCGVEDLGAILTMNARTGETSLFLPRLSAREEMYTGANLLSDETAKARLGLSNLYDVSYFDEYLARFSGWGAPLWLRLQPGDQVDNARYEVLIFEARKNRTHYNAQITRDAFRLQRLRERYPAWEVKDVTPHLDALRAIKSEEEIAVLRRNGKLSAEAVRQAMLASRPGVFEYEIEAAARYVTLKGGAKGMAFAPIVGSGPNTCIWHYDANSRRTRAGDLVLMDFGADLDHMAMDITRTWPVSGVFSPEQREIYEIVLTIEQACLEAYKPGATNADVQARVAEALKQKGLNGRGERGGFGHFVGLGTHDVGPRITRLEEGMVFAIEPALYIPEKAIGIRIEDTVVISKDGCEVLTRDAPKTIAEIEKLLGRR
ncbi:MAG: Xaa-Pro peptidase family protein [Acidobacteriota bacterium]|nr:Xaa-Pro peptidase family protein [Acidobacteriota bacterium]